MKPGRTIARITHAAALAAVMCAHAGSMAAGRQVAADAACAELNGRNIAAADIGLPTTGALVTSSQLIAR